MVRLEKKQWFVIALLGLVAVAPAFLSTKKRSGKLAPATVVAPDRSSLEIIAEADAALIRMDEMLHEESSPKVDDELRKASFSTLDVSQPEIRPTVEAVRPEEVALTPSPTSEPMVVPEEKFASDELKERVERERAEIRKREAELVAENTRLKAEQLKLAHELEGVSTKGVAVATLNEKVRTLESEIERLTKLSTEQSKILASKKEQRGDLDRRLNEEGKLRKSLEDQLETAVRKKEEQQKENERLKRSIGDFEKRIKLLEEQRLAESEEKEQVLMKQVATLRKDLLAVQATNDELKKKQKTIDSELATARSQLEEFRKGSETKQKMIDELTVKLSTAEQGLAASKDLQQDLARTKSALLLAEERVRAVLASPSRGGSAAPQVSYPSFESPRPASDQAMVEVIVPKAKLRAGPGEEHSVVMEIQQGSQLVVETRMGDWLRVVTPKGSRAFLRKDLSVELDASGRPRYPVEPPVAIQPPRPVEQKAPASPPSADPYTDLLGKQFVRPPADAPAAAPEEQKLVDEEEAKKAFENLKLGVGAPPAAPPQ